jgi:hypothetical protein
MAASLKQEQQALAQVVRADEEEAHRVFWWRLLARPVKILALGLARMSKARADDDLSTFTIQERAMIHAVVLNLRAQMKLVEHCMGIAVEHKPLVNADGTRARQLELEQQQEGNERRRQEFARLQEQEQHQGKGRLH